MKRNKEYIPNLMEEFDKKLDEEECDDIYSPTSWDKDPYESDEEYEERIQDQEDMMDYYND